MITELRTAFEETAEYILSDPERAERSFAVLASALPSCNSDCIRDFVLEIGKVLRPHSDNPDLMRRAGQVLARLFSMAAPRLDIPSFRLLSGLTVYLTKSIPAAEPAATFAAAICRACPPVAAACTRPDGSTDSSAVSAAVALVRTFFAAGVRTSYFDTSARASLIYVLGRPARALAAHAARPESQKALTMIAAHLARAVASESHPACLAAYFEVGGIVFPAIDLSNEPLAPPLSPPPGRPANLGNDDQRLSELIFESYAAFFPLRYVPDPSAPPSLTAAAVTAAFKKLWTKTSRTLIDLEIGFLVDIAEGAADDEERTDALELIADIAENDPRGLETIAISLSTVFWALSQDAVQLKNEKITERLASVLGRLCRLGPAPLADKLLQLALEYVVRDIDFESGGDTFIIQAVSALASSVAGAGAAAAVASVKSVVPALLTSIGRRAEAADGDTESCGGTDKAVAVTRLARIKMLAEVAAAAADGFEGALQADQVVQNLTQGVAAVLNMVLGAQMGGAMRAEEGRRVCTLVTTWFTKICPDVAPEAASAPAAQELALLLTELSDSGAEFAAHALAAVVAAAGAPAAPAAPAQPQHLPHTLAALAAASPESAAALAATCPAGPGSQFNDVCMALLSARKTEVTANAARKLLDEELLACGDDISFIITASSRLSPLLSLHLPSPPPAPPAAPVWALAAAAPAAPYLLPHGIDARTVPPSSQVPHAAWASVIAATRGEGTSDVAAAAAFRRAPSAPAAVALVAAAAAEHNYLLLEATAAAAGPAGGVGALLGALAQHLTEHAAAGAVAVVLREHGAGEIDAELATGLCEGLMSVLEADSGAGELWAGVACLLDAFGATLSPLLPRIAVSALSSLSAINWTAPAGWTASLLNALRCLAGDDIAGKAPYQKRMTLALGRAVGAGDRQVRAAARAARCAWYLLE